MSVVKTETNISLTEGEDDYGKACAAAQSPPRKNRPALGLLRTDTISLDNIVLSSSAESPANDSSDQGPRSQGFRSPTWAWEGVAGLLATPKNCLNSARRTLFTAPCFVGDAPKQWVRLELRIGMDSLVNGAGNGRLGKLILALRMEFARSLGIEPLQVDVTDVFEMPGGSKTVVDILVSPDKFDRSLDLSKVAADLMDQVERNRASVDDAADLLKLISFVEVKNHGSVRLLWNSQYIGLVLLLFMALSHYYGVFAFSAGATPTLGLRASAPSIDSIPRSLRDARAPHLSTHFATPPQARRAPQGAQAARMLDPMTVSALAFGCADKMWATAASPSPTRRAVVAAKRAAKDVSTSYGTMLQTGGARTVMRRSLSNLATQTLLANDEDERPVRHEILQDVSDHGIDLVDKLTAHVAGNSHMLHKTLHVAIKAAHLLDACAMQHPALAGITSMALVSGVVLSISLSQNSATVT